MTDTAPRVTRKAEAQADYRRRTGDFMGRTYRVAMLELVRRHREEFDALLAEVRASAGHG